MNNLFLKIENLYYIKHFLRGSGPVAKSKDLVANVPLF
jgi:hypothetical protein